MAIEFIQGIGIFGRNPGLEYDLWAIQPFGKPVCISQEYTKQVLRQSTNRGFPGTR